MAILEGTYSVDTEAENRPRSDTLRGVGSSALHNDHHHGALLACSFRQLLNDLQLIFSVFKTLTDQQVTVELKNDLSITGVLKSVDQCV